MQVCKTSSIGLPHQSLRKNLDLGITGKPLRLDGGTNRSDVDHAVAHHAAVVQDVFVGTSQSQT